MRTLSRILIALCCTGALSALGGQARAGEAGDKIDFATQVQPILKTACYDCHGPEKQKGKLRLDSRELALEGGGSGPAIVPGHSRESYLVKRILGEGDEDRMPIKRDPLTAEQVAVVQKWIDQGAPWPDSANLAGAAIAKHWAYQKPVRPELPAVMNQAWVRNPIDTFVLAKLEKEHLPPSPEADRVTLIRRLYLDLIGLPPSPAEVDGFVNDPSPNAYESLVDRLLANPHYGERWGRHWLDLARYADTNGYEKDRTRSIWPYRDWVIRALNTDMPFDEFTIEQLAGDMLPNATPEQRIATGFHRNTMINEEGGIDVEEFRYKAMVDRVQTTSATWLGTTLHCAQCHNHKYDPITQKEYYQLYALLNNADEPEMNVPSPQIDRQRAEIQSQIARIESELESHFPSAELPKLWTVVAPAKVSSAAGTILQLQADGSILASGPHPGSDVYTIVANGDFKNITAIRLEALVDPSLPRQGPGRAPNGNFVLSSIVVTGDGGKVIPLRGANADVSQPGFPVTDAIDPHSTAGWAVDAGNGSANRNHAAIFQTNAPVTSRQLTITLRQNYLKHSIGRFRISIDHQSVEPPSVPVSREAFLDKKFAEWEQQLTQSAAHWTVLDPVKFSRNYGGSITRLPDRSLLFTGDNLYRDEYKMEFTGVHGPVTAIRMEVLPDPESPNNGPGRSPSGGWLVSEFSAGRSAPLTLSHATADVGKNPENAIDSKRDTHWVMTNGDARPHEIVFRVDNPAVDGDTLAVSVVQNYHQQENVGRLRISVTSDAGDIRASGVPAEIEAIVLIAQSERSIEQRKTLRQYFLSVTPLLAVEHQKIDQLRKSMPQYTTTLVMQERAVPRVTNIHRRGEFLNLGAEVTPNVPAVLPPLPAGQPHNRLTFARWLISGDNPLTARVVMNRMWATYFGRGIVRSVEDFGAMGEPATHPELLDWLATEFVRQHWSQKAMHRLIVTSATYRQSSAVSPALQQRDPANELLARGARLRVEAEIVRDIALSAGGLLTEAVGGPSVFPPQPEGVGAVSYSNSPWVASSGPDRFRRGLYTFLRRTSPNPQLITFDAPTSELVCSRRIRSDTPLQALTTLNDTAFVEAAQGLARRVLTEGPKDDANRARYAFRLCVSREPDARELAKITDFYTAQLARFQIAPAVAKELTASDFVKPPDGVDPAQLAAWTTVARALLNLDETITKE